jgi:hypothetical protein
LIYEAGAYPGSPVGAGSGVIFGPYKLENLQIDGYDVVVNRPKAARLPRARRHQRRLCRRNRGR